MDRRLRMGGMMQDYSEKASALEMLFAGRFLNLTGMALFALGVIHYLNLAAHSQAAGTVPVLLGTLAGSALVVTGWVNHRLGRVHYAEPLMAGGLGLLMLTVGAGAFEFALLTGPGFLVLVAGLVALAGWVAIRWNSLLIANLTLGALFVGPWFMTFDLSQHTLLLCYLTAISLGVTVVAYHYKWDYQLIATFLGSLWLFLTNVGLLSRPLLSMIFLTGLYLLFLVANHLVYFVREDSSHYNLYLSHINPLVFAGLSYWALLRLGHGWAVLVYLVLGLTHLGIARAAYGRKGLHFLDLATGNLGLGLLFLTAAVSFISNFSTGTLHPKLVNLVMFASMLLLWTFEGIFLLRVARGFPALGQTLRVTAYLCFALAAVQLFWVMPEIPGLVCRLVLKLIATAAFARAFAELLKEPAGELRTAGLSLMALASVGSFGAAVAEMAASTLLALALIGGLLMAASLRVRALSGLAYLGGLAWAGVSLELFRRPLPEPSACQSLVVLVLVLAVMGWFLRQVHPVGVWVPAGLGLGKLALVLLQVHFGLLPLALGGLLLLTPYRYRVLVPAGLGLCALAQPQTAVLGCLGLSLLAAPLRLKWDTALLLVPGVFFVGGWPMMVLAAGILALHLYHWRADDEMFTGLAMMQLLHLALWAGADLPTWGLTGLGLVSTAVFLQQRRLRQLLPFSMLTLWAVWLVGDPLSWIWGSALVALVVGVLLARADLEPGWAFLLASLFLLCKSALWVAPVGLLWLCLGRRHEVPSSMLVFCALWGLAASPLTGLAVLILVLAAAYAMEAEFQNRCVLGGLTLALILKSFLSLGSGPISTAATAALALVLLARGQEELKNGGRLLFQLAFIKAILVDTNFNLEAGAWDIAIWGTLDGTDALFMILTVVALGAGAWVARSNPLERNAFLLGAQIALAFQITTALHSIYGILDQFQVLLSIFWSLTSFFIIALGVFRELKVFRLFGLVLLSASALKICAVDLWVLGAYSKVGTLLILGALLMVVSFLYQSHGDRLTAARSVPEASRQRLATFG